ncbi:VOC family protein [Flavobacterium sp. T12S277]
MELKFSHIDILVNDLQAACDYYAKILGAQISKKFTWERDELHVTYAVVKIGEERFMLVQPFSGNLKNLIDTKG